MANFFRWTALTSAIVLLISISAAIVVSKPPVTPPDNQVTEKGEIGQIKQKTDETLWDRLFPDSISLYTLFLVVFTAVLSLAGLIQLNSLWRAEIIPSRSADAAKEAAQIAHRTLVETQRPWIEAVQVTAGPLVYDQQGARITISAKINNVGSVPAINVRLSALIYLIGKQLDVLGMQRTICEAVKGWKGESDKILFPARTDTLSVNIPISQSDIDKSTLATPGESRKFISPVLIGCIDYTRTIDDTHHQTGFAYQMSEFENGGVYVIYPDRGDIPAERIKLTPWAGGGFFAS